MDVSPCRYIKVDLGGAYILVGGSVISRLHFIYPISNYGLCIVHYKRPDIV